MGPAFLAPKGKESGAVAMAVVASWIHRYTAPAPENSRGPTTKNTERVTMSYIDEFEHWMAGTDKPDYDAMFDEELGRLIFREPVILPPTASLRAAIALMNDSKIGCLLVGTTTSIEGIFTERDVLGRVAAADLDLDEAILGDFMTPNPECLGIDDQIVHALNAMIVGGYRHVPILCEGRPVGVFGMRDCMRFIVDLHPRAVLNAPPPGMKHNIRREGE